MMIGILWVGSEKNEPKRKTAKEKIKKLLLYLTDRWTDKYRSAVNGDLFFYPADRLK
jgi:phage pi2 protein 07